MWRPHIDDDESSAARFPVVVLLSAHGTYRRLFNHTWRVAAAAQICLFFSFKKKYFSVEK